MPNTTGDFRFLRGISKISKARIKNPIATKIVLNCLWAPAKYPEYKIAPMVRGTEMRLKRAMELDVIP